MCRADKIKMTVETMLTVGLEKTASHIDLIRSLVDRVVKLMS
jgi:hypothetical protein